MNKYFLIIVSLCSALYGHARCEHTIEGKVLDSMTLEPMALVNVVLLNLTDSSFVNGTVTQDDGTFAIISDNKEKILKVSSVGYVTRYILVEQDSIGVIMMRPDTQILGEVVVKSRVPSYKMTGEGMQTNVENTVLSKLGTGEDVLAHVPGIIKKQDGFEVFGKGVPIIYINGRLVRDVSELDQLKSEDVKSIELITNPGAKYDASVKAVVKIRTKALHGEGFGFDVRSSYYQSENTDLVDELNWNYRHNRLDVFGTFHYLNNKTHGYSNLTTLVQAETLWRQKVEQEIFVKRHTLRNIIGANYMLDDNNSTGFRYTLTLHPRSHTNGSLISDVTANDEYYDHIDNIIHMDEKHRAAHLLNIYYNGRIDKAEIDFNADYLYNNERNHIVYDEQSTSKDSRVVNSENIERNELFASKLTVGYPLLGGKLTLGAEYTHTKRDDNYINHEQYVPTSFAKKKESNISSFVEYSRQLSILQLIAGLRYEWADCDYYENGLRVDGLSRSFGNIFPSLSVGAQIGNLQLQLGYTSKTRRPTYHQLSNNVIYANYFLLQSGNPLLNREYIHNVSFLGVWESLQLSIDYNDRRDAIVYWAYPQEGNTSVTRITFKNLPTLKSLSAHIVAAPKFGIWSPQLSAGIGKQWLTLQTDVNTYSLSKPYFQFSIDNAFDFGHGWLASADANLMTKGHYDNGYFTRSSGTVNVSLTKSFLNDRLSVRMQGTDLFLSNKHGYLMYENMMQSNQENGYDSRQFVLTVRYKFNSIKSKYKGTGAGNLEKNRL